MLSIAGIVRSALSFAAPCLDAGRKKTAVPSSGRTTSGSRTGWTAEASSAPKAEPVPAVRPFTAAGSLPGVPPTGLLSFPTGRPAPSFPFCFRSSWPVRTVSPAPGASSCMPCMSGRSGTPKPSPAARGNHEAVPSGRKRSGMQASTFASAGSDPGRSAASFRARAGFFSHSILDSVLKTVSFPPFRSENGRLCATPAPQAFVAVDGLPRSGEREPHEGGGFGQSHAAYVL